MGIPRLTMIPLFCALAACAGGGGDGNDTPHVTPRTSPRPIVTKAGVWKGKIGDHSYTVIIDSRNDVYGYGWKDVGYTNAHQSLIGNIGGYTDFDGGLTTFEHSVDVFQRDRYNPFGFFAA